MQNVIILGMQNENKELIHKELIFDISVEVNVYKIENYVISDSYDLCPEVNFSGDGEIVIAHILLDHSDLEDINKFYEFIISEFKENGANLLCSEFITEDDLINKYGFESEIFY